MINRLTEYRGADYYTELRRILKSEEGQAIIDEMLMAKASTNKLTQFDLCVVTLNHNLPFKAIVEWLEENKAVPTGLYDRLIAQGFKVDSALRKVAKERKTPW